MGLCPARREDVLATYPVGSTIEYVAAESHGAPETSCFLPFWVPPVTKDFGAGSQRGLEEVGAHRSQRAQFDELRQTALPHRELSDVDCAGASAPLARRASFRRLRLSRT